MAIPIGAILLGGGLLLMTMNKKGSGGGGSATGGVASQQGAVDSGSPKIEIKKSDINPLLNSVHFTVFYPDGTQKKYVQKRRNGPIQKIVGPYTLITRFEPTTVREKRDGSSKVDPMGILDISIKRGSKVLTAKRVIVNDKNVVDLI